MNFEVQVTQAELGQLIGVGQARVSQLVAEGVIVGVTIADQVGSYTAHLRAVAAGRVDAPEVATERARLLAAQARREELKLAKDRGEVILVEAVRIGLARSLSALRDAMLALSDRLAPALAPETDARAVHRMLSAEIHRALTEFARGTAEISGTDAATAGEAAE